MRILFLFFAAQMILSCSNNDQQTASHEVASAHAGDSTTIQWLDPTTQELGKAKEGQVLEISWRFKNTGNKPLVISDVRAGCGCTVAEKPQEPIAPGGQGVIKAKFDTRGQLYSQHKNVYVQANNSNKNAGIEDVLSFKVEVEKQ